jgi:hypothetical protein
VKGGLVSGGKSGDDVRPRAGWFAVLLILGMIIAGLCWRLVGVPALVSMVIALAVVGVVCVAGGEQGSSGEQKWKLWRRKEDVGGASPRG